MPQNPILTPKDPLIEKSLYQLKDLLINFNIKKTLPILNKQDFPFYLTIFISIGICLYGIIIEHPLIGMLIGIIFPSYFLSKYRSYNIKIQKQDFIYPEINDYQLESYCVITDKTKKFPVSAAIYNKWGQQKIVFFSSSITEEDKIEFDSYKKNTKENISQTKEIFSVEVLLTKISDEICGDSSIIIFGHFIFDNKIHFIAKILPPVITDINILANQITPIIQDFIELNQNIKTNQELLSRTKPFKQNIN